MNKCILNKNSNNLNHCIHYYICTYHTWDGKGSVVRASPCRADHAEVVAASVHSVLPRARVCRKALPAVPSTYTRGRATGVRIATGVCNTRPRGPAQRQARGHDQAITRGFVHDARICTRALSHTWARFPRTYIRTNKGWDILSMSLPEQNRPSICRKMHATHEAPPRLSRHASQEAARTAPIPRGPHVAVVDPIPVGPRPCAPCPRTA